jgi:hypothetical protein
VILHWFTKVFPALQEQRRLTMACDETGGNRLSDLAEAPEASAAAPSRRIAGNFEFLQ